MRITCKNVYIHVNTRNCYFFRDTCLQNLLISLRKFLLSTLLGMKIEQVRLQADNGVCSTYFNIICI